MGKRDEHKGNDMPFSVGPHGRTRARVLVLIAAVNANNFTRLISLSLAVPARSRGEDGRAGTKKKEKKRGQREIIILQYKSATYRITRLPLRSRASLSRWSRSARRLIKFSGNQICHSAVRF